MTNFQRESLFKSFIQSGLWKEYFIKRTGEWSIKSCQQEIGRHKIHHEALKQALFYFQQHQSGWLLGLKESRG